MPEMLAALAPTAMSGIADAFSAAAPAAIDAGASLAGDLGGLAATGLTDVAAGVPFAAGMGDLGSIAGAGAGSFGSVAGAVPGAIGDVASTLGNFGFGLSDGGGLASMIPAGAGDFGTAALSFPGMNGATDLSGASASAFPGATPFNSFGNTGASVASVGDVAGAVPGVGAAPTPAAAGAAPVAGAAAPAGAAPVDLTSMLSKAVGGNPLSAALGAAGLGYTIFNGQKQTAATGAIQDQASKVAGTAADVMSQGKSLVSHLDSGTLPPNIQAQVDQNTKAAKTKIISNYAAQGMNTDPNHNSSLRQELMMVDQQAKVLSGQLAQQLAASGTNLISAGTQLTGLDNNLLTTLSNIDQTQTQRMGSAIANFAAALNGNKGGINLKLA